MAEKGVLKTSWGACCEATMAFRVASWGKSSSRQEYFQYTPAPVYGSRCFSLS